MLKSTKIRNIFLVKFQAPFSQKILNMTFILFICGPIKSTIASDPK